MGGGLTILGELEEVAGLVEEVGGILVLVTEEAPAGEFLLRFLLEVVPASLVVAHPACCRWRVTVVPCGEETGVSLVGVLRRTKQERWARSTRLGARVVWSSFIPRPWAGSRRGTTAQRSPVKTKGPIWIWRLKETD